MIIGIGQINIIWEDELANMRKVETLVEEASMKGVELILFPEMTLTGVTLNIDKLTLSQDKIIEWCRALAIKNNINIGIGYGKRIDSKALNNYIVISNYGEVITDYTKIHLFTYGGEPTTYYNGINIENYKIGEFSLSSFICYDLRFPEIFQVAARKAEVITIAANWPKSKIDEWISFLKVRALETQSYIIGINRLGEGSGIKYNGQSAIISPRGEILNNLNDKEELIIQEIKLEEVCKSREKFNIRDDRREDLYKKYYS
ncbi:carbon-nitrogen family hydrolase [Clostridium botulinum]|uniref:Carbon-nitrogen family hydrolase n=1 Tax=Clostridium botulinum TaxID=1491 RepID=A0A0C2SFU5_CLOBO|nr:MULTISPECIES: nitrilase-related carbon-nitrogen hydrolase [Clostridium]KAI3348977.1 carbon-nitrogen family hydrolase [Clostridium botulinum]KIL08106.1 amidohydrolase [Clostridium botulinum]KOM89158.1 amidohydrolase [Clostridium botulinum]KOR55542.1 amidohydrolase [Clostridium botulinum]MBN1036753.1 carbon-nitrogen family hydrolase [Clostridium botulinum]